MEKKRQSHRKADSVKPIRGVLFDKDATVLDFNSYWIPFFHQLMKDMAEKCVPENPEPMLRASYMALGFDWETGEPGPEIYQIKPKRVALRLIRVMFRGRVPLIRVLKNANWLKGRASELQKELLPHVKPIGRLYELLDKMKSQEIKIGLVTIDRRHSAQRCMEHLGIDDRVDFLATSGGDLRAKPAPDAMEAFCREFGLSSDEVAMVGDAVIDMRFARKAKAGYAVGVRTGSGENWSLRRLSDVIYDSIDDLLDDERIFPRES